MENKSRKRIRDVSLHKRNIIKKAKVHGQEHVGHTGKFVAARVTGPACGCKKGCIDMISDHNKHDILTTFYENMETKVQQDTFLQGLIEVTPIARKRPRNVQNSKERSSSYKYFIQVGCEKINACKAAFCSIYAIGKKRVEILSAKKRDNIIPRENRGGARHCMDPSIIQVINDHIESFPVKTTHYGTKEFQYLDSRLNVQRMYDMFRLKYPDTKVKYEFYLHQFNYNHCLHFGRPQVDTCSTCEELSTKIKSPSLNPAAKRVAAAEKIVHCRRSKKFYNKMNEIEEKCKADETVAAFCFDYMQNLPLPNIPVQEIFYLRQLWVYAFCIHDFRTGKANFYVYHEGIARKSLNEVCSLVLKQINENVDERVKELHLFADACGGQNRNHALVRLCSALTVVGRFHRISLYFPIRGHSYLPCDRHFGVAKRFIKKTDRVYVPEEYVEMIKNSREKQPKFEVKMVEPNDVLSVKKWWPRYFQKSSVSDETRGRSGDKNNKDHFQISQCRMFEFSVSLKGKVVASQYIDGLEKSTFKLLKANIMPELPVDLAYDGQVPIKSAKVADIRKVVQYIDPVHKEFYDAILEWKTADIVNSDDDDD